MRKNQLINLALFSAIVILGLVAWLDPFSPAEPEYERLLSINKQSIQRISLIKGGQVSFSLEKQIFEPESAWQIVQPIKLPANPMKVLQLLNLASTNSLRQYQIKSEQLAKLGLAEPAWEIVFETDADRAGKKNTGNNRSAAGIEKFIIGFGKTEPISQLRYVLVNNTVHLINDRVSQFNFGSPLMLANLDILPVDKSVKEVHLPDRVIRRVDGQWQSSSPAEKSVSQTTYKEFIDEWRYAQASRVALADKSESNIDAQAVTVFLEKAEQPIHFMVETSGQDFIVTNKDWGVRYYLNGSVGEKLLHIDSTAKEQ